MQLWPANENAFAAIASAAASMSASAVTITGVALPSSRLTRFLGARSASFQPTAPEPVNVSALTRSSSIRTSPISEAGPTSTFTHPGGRPASVSSSASNSAESGVWLAGFVRDIFRDFVVAAAEVAGDPDEDLGAFVGRHRLAHRRLGGVDRVAHLRRARLRHSADGFA